MNGDINTLNSQVPGSNPLPPNSAITIIGWSAELNTTACATVTRVDLFADDHFLGTAQVGLPRQDVANVYGNQNCLNSGWSFTGTLAGVDPGQHILLARAYDHTGGSLLLSPRPQIMVSSAMPPSSVTNSSLTQYAFSLGYAPNGNVDYSYDSVNGNWAYLYDNLNRLNAAGSTQGSLAWNYDSFGNRWAQTVTGGSGFAAEQSFNSNTNRTDQGCYDSAGNMINSWGWVCSGPYLYAYDAESRMVSSNWGNTTYTYDAEGRRVATRSGSAVTYYFYDDQGHSIAQYNGSGNLILRDIYAGERHLATYADQQGTTVFPLTDWLGTERARSDVTGNLCQTTTSQPFGDGQQINGTCAPGSKFFAGLERDSESGLDHTMFRQYSSTTGRWMSPDPYNGSMDINYPQTFNRYAYVGNSPLGYTDPSGLDSVTIPCAPNSGADICTMSTIDGGGSSGGFVGVAIEIGIDIAKIFGFFHKPPFKGKVGDPRPNNTGRRCIGANCGKPAPHNDPILKKSPWAVSGFVPVPPVEIIGVVPSLAYIPETNTVCVGIGGGVGGRGINGGPLIFSDPANAEEIISGYGWSATAQATPFIGYTAMWNSSGMMSGPTVGTPGLSISYGKNWCF